MVEHSPVVLLVEDEPQIRQFVRASLEGEGWRVCEAETMQRGLIDAGSRRPDLIILDLGLPDGDGVDYIRRVRDWSSVPVIVLSARSDEMEKVAALDAGADDYLTKPFGVAELLARTRAALRRKHQAPIDGRGVIRFGDVEVDTHARTVTKAGEAVHLTTTEYRLLSVLINHAGRVVTNPQLLKDVWGPMHSESGHYLRVYMRHLRQKLEEDPAQPKYLLTETAVGYRLFIPS
ncbi:MAG TPA: two-component system response regulator KdpE [Noviherbaspirillum sp.]|jgi:two-component system KDP operon response regulator KdpE